MKPGDLIFKDQKNDGRIDEYDMIAMGYNTSCPEIYYGFDFSAGYQGFGLFMQFQGVGNYSKWLNTPSVYRPLFRNKTISQEYYDNRWTPENLNAKYPRLTADGSNNNYSNNSLWLANASFLKLRTVELHYNLRSRIFKTSPFYSSKLYVRGHDLLTFSKMKIDDPEGMAVDHPLMKQIVFGINIRF